MLANIIISEMDIDEDEANVNVQRTSETSKRAKDKAAHEEDDSKKKKMNGIKHEPEENSKGGKKDDDDDEKAEKPGTENEDDNVRTFSLNEH